jgi:hypothetical protein
VVFQVAQPVPGKQYLVIGIAHGFRCYRSGGAGRARWMRQIMRARTGRHLCAVRKLAPLGVSASR